jgi:hypothetical protein
MRELARVSVDGADVPIVLNEAHSQFELSIGGSTAILAYNRRHGALALIHTEVPLELRGKHIADALAEAALDYAREERLAVKPYCPFVAGYLKRHPEYADLVDRDFKREEIS